MPQKKKIQTKIQLLFAILNRHRKPLLFLTICWGIFFAFLWANMLTVNESGLIVRHEYVWSDWAIHIGLGSIFQLRSPANWFISHPIFAGSSLSYPFLTNLISGLLMRLGFSLQFAFLVPSFIFSMLLVYGIYFLAFQFTKSQMGGVVAVFIFLIGSGLGFDRAIGSLLQGQQLTNVLIPNEYYSRVENYQWFSGNALVGMLIPQRAFLLGMTSGVWIINGLIRILVTSKERLIKFTSRKKFVKRAGTLVVLGLISGFMTITHVHSFIALVFISAGFFSISWRTRWREWLVYGCAAGISALILYKLFIAGSIQNPTFMQFKPWWTYGNGITWLAQWWRNWGFIWPLSVLGIVISYRRGNRLLLGLISGLLVLFIISNLILFQPVAWDNSKLFLWVYLGLTLATTVALIRIWHSKLKLVVVFLMLLLMLTGFLDLAKIINVETTQNFTLETTSGIELANYVAHNTPETAVILTAPTHNHPVTVLGARTIFMGYQGWLYNYGFNYASRAEQVRLMFEEPEANEGLFIENKLNYIVIGPDENHEYQIDKAYFQDNWELIFQNQDYQLWQRV